MNEGYFFFGQSINFDTDVNVQYTSLRDSIITETRIITTNPYSVLVALSANNGERFDDIELGKKWSPKLDLFQKGLFSKLCSFMSEHSALSRSSLIILEGNNQALELKAATYCVAFEALCHTIKKLRSVESPKIIDDNTWSGNVKPKLDALTKLLVEEGIINASQQEIFSKKINNLNQPTNRDVLTAPFKSLGYTLSKVELQCVNNRNQFLHGSLPFKEDIDNAFGELFFIALILHKLYHVLFLRLIGYEGYIINYPKLFEDLTRKKVEEEPFILI